MISAKKAHGMTVTQVQNVTPQVDTIVQQMNALIAAHKTANAQMAIIVHHQEHVKQRFQMAQIA